MKHFIGQRKLHGITLRREGGSVAGINKTTETKGECIMGRFYSIDNILYDAEDRKLGRIAETEVDSFTQKHAESLEITEGEYVRLTGTLFIFKALDELIFYQLRRETA